MRRVTQETVRLRVLPGLSEPPFSSAPSPRSSPQWTGSHLIWK